VRRALALVAIPLLAGCASAAGRPEAIPISRDVPRLALPALALRNAGFESPARTPNHCAERWDCTVHADPGSFTFSVQDHAPAEGRQAMCVQRVGKEPWATLTQGVHDASLQGATLRLSMMLRLEGVSGDGAGPWVVLHGPGGRMLKHDQKLLQGTTGWARAAIDIEVLPGTEIVEVGATLEGPGKACIDDVRLEVLKAARRGPV
jgi:hypothetical protein